MRVGVRPPAVRALLERLLAAALEAADPTRGLRRFVRRRGNRLTAGPRRYDLGRYRRIVAVGAGKASSHMGAALEDILGDHLQEGLIVVKYGHAAPTRVLTVSCAAHPVPDEAGRREAGRLHRLVAGLSKDDLLFVLLSGGASSLLPAPAPGITLADKQATTQLLLRSGAEIHEINAVRKHLSSLKGGRLAEATGATIISLILSDVIGDDLGTIASGLTAPDRTTYAEACGILTRYGIWNKVPRDVRRVLTAGKRGHRAESPKPGAALFRRVHDLIIGNNAAAVDAVARTAKQAGLQPLVLSTSLTGEAREAGRLFGAFAREIVSTGRPLRRPACIIAGGELTVSVRGPGTGGRAQEFVLSAAREIAGLPDVYVAGFGTDGTDGPTDAAGAVADGRSAMRAERLGLNVTAAMLANDAYPFLRALDALIVTGPTGTNVNDLYLLIVP